MAIKVQGTIVIDDSTGLRNITDLDATTVNTIVTAIDANTLDSAEVISLIDSAYVQARSPSYVGFDSDLDAALSGNVTIGGNLTVNGTTTTVNSTELTIDDKNIVLASGAANAAAADGGGITLDGANATITYNSTNDTWDFNKEISGEIKLNNIIEAVYDSATSALGIGSFSLVNNTASAYNNTAIGYEAGRNNQCGDANVLIGNQDGM